MCLALLFATLALRAEPAQAVLGQAERVELRIVAQGEDANGLPELWTSAGTISNLRVLSPGSFAATWRAPRERSPRVALIQATLGSGEGARRAFLALPVFSEEPLSIATKPNSEAELLVGGRRFGPVHTDDAGSAQIRARLAPDVTTATVRVRDPFGNVNESVIDLRPPPFQRLRLVSYRPRASSTENAPVLLEVFAVTRSGRPAPARHLRLSAEGGRLGAIRAIGPGLFRAELRPLRGAAGQARVRARLVGDPRVETLAIALLAGPPAEVRLRATPPSVEGGGEVAVEAVLVDADGNPVEGQVSFEADAGQVVPRGPRSAALRVEAAHGGRSSIAVRARCGALEAAVDIALRPGPSARAVLALSEPLREGQAAQATVELSDEGGNPVSGATLEVAAEGGAAAGPAREIAPGRYAFPLRAEPGSAPGPARVRVRSGAASSEAGFAVLPVRRLGRLAAGILLGGRSNFSRAHAAGFEAELSMRPGPAPVELLGRVGLLRFAASRTPLLAPDIAQQGELSGLSLALGARAELPLPLSFALHGTLLAGALRSFGSVRIQGGAADGARQGVASWGPMAAAALGTSFRAGAGRALAELQFTESLGRGDVSGNLGGLGLSLGYLLALR